jgi:hypothetical protein
VPEAVSENEAETRMLRFFHRVATYIQVQHRDRVTVAIEPNARVYGCNFLFNSVQAEAFVRKLGRSSIRLVLDTGCMLLEEEDPIVAMQRCMDILCHVHFSAPHLGPLSLCPAIPYAHLYNWLLAHPSFVNKRITIEMLPSTPELAESSVRCVLREPVINVIGAGWFGCHATTRLLQHGRVVQLLEREGVFSGSSFYNQNRLHLGFHYPRSHATRVMCREYFSRFRKEYGFAVEPIAGNVYGISRESQIDFSTFLQIMRASNLQWTEAGENSVLGCEGAIQVDEMFINHQKMRAYFTVSLANVLHKRCFEPAAPTRADIVIDCSNNNVFEDKNEQLVSNETTVSLVYRRIGQSSQTSAWTIMDGRFISLFPLDPCNNLYTLTHVQHSPQQLPIEISTIIALKHLFEQSAREYVPNFDTDFVYVDFFASKKAKLRSSCASRNLVCSMFQNVVSVSAGKITAIYDMETALEWLY